jgi:7-carboxy-7-deazaguanine synthase
MDIATEYKLPVNEIFATLQGEATFAGTPSVFIRLQGCDVACSWCDTKHTWELNPNTFNNDFTIITVKEQDKESWSYVKDTELVDYIQTNFSYITHIVITGGEPAQYNLVPLCIKLEQLGKTIQIETSGTEELRISKETWVTLSPKINMPGNKKLIQASINRANEIKMPIGKIADIDKLKQFIIDYKIAKQIPIWLQALSQNPTATKLCIEQAMLHNWKLSVQTHKYLNIR